MSNYYQISTWRYVKVSPVWILSTVLKDNHFRLFFWPEIRKSLDRKFDPFLVDWLESILIKNIFARKKLILFCANFFESSHSRINYHQKSKFDEIFITAKNFLKVYTLDGCSVFMIHVFTNSITTEHFVACENN